MIARKIASGYSTMHELHAAPDERRLPATKDFPSVRELIHHNPDGGSLLEP